MTVPLLRLRYGDTDLLRSHHSFLVRGTRLKTTTALFTGLRDHSFRHVQRRHHSCVIVATKGGGYEPLLMNFSTAGAARSLSRSLITDVAWRGAETPVVTSPTLNIDSDFLLPIRGVMPFVFDKPGFAICHLSVVFQINDSIRHSRQTDVFH